MKEAALALLKEKSIVFEAKSEHHYVVQGNEGYLDFWPTTGKWFDRQTKKKGFGARNLVTHLNVPL